MDALLLLMALIWGANYTFLKIGLAEVPPHAFNAVRLVLASGIFLAAIAARPGDPVSSSGNPHTTSPGGSPLPPARRRERRSWLARSRFSTRDLATLLALGTIGHLGYQLCFIGGVARTSVANSSLILGCSPVAVVLLTTAAGHERIRAPHWAGACLSVLGIYLVVGRGAAVEPSAFIGDVLMVLSVFCWAIYTVGARHLLERHSPLVVTGVTMAFGTVMYVPVAVPQLLTVDWGSVSAAAWLSLVYSAVLALCAAYLIWYTAVQRIGNARTSIYSNMVPLFALAIAAIWLDEPIGATKLAGAAAILTGVALTKVPYWQSH